LPSGTEAGRCRNKVHRKQRQRSNNSSGAWPTA
jgi:hypothetical protein